MLYFRIYNSTIKYVWRIMRMNIEMLPAQQGDSFLLNFDNGVNILIDMGYADTYKNYLHSKLSQIKSRGQCVDLLVITHIDADHIEGAIEFFKENGAADSPNIVEVKEIWYNAYKNLDIQEGKAEEVCECEQRKLSEIRLCQSKRVKKSGLTSESVSISQGNALAGLLYKYGYESRWNTSFENRAVNLDIKQEVYLKNIKMFMLSPNNRKLEAILEKWNRFLFAVNPSFENGAGKIFDDVYEGYVKSLLEDGLKTENIAASCKKIAYFLEHDFKQDEGDKAVSNGTSIAFILEYGKIKLLFLGDAHEDVILSGLKIYKALGNSLDFDVIKVSHHGSLKNNFQWIDKITSENYLFSTNGCIHKHPALEVIAKILKQKSGHKTLYFNYQIECIKELDDVNLKKNWDYEVFISKNIHIGVK